MPNKALSETRVKAHERLVHGPIPVSLVGIERGQQFSFWRLTSP